MRRAAVVGARAHFFFSKSKNFHANKLCRFGNLSAVTTSFVSVGQGVGRPVMSEP